MDLLIVRHANAFAPDRLLTSPLVRARQTAQILTDVAGWPKVLRAQIFIGVASFCTQFAPFPIEATRMAGHQRYKGTVR